MEEDYKGEVEVNLSRKKSEGALLEIGQLTYPKRRMRK